MKTTAEVRMQKSDDKLQFLAARLDKWDITHLVDTSKVDVKALEKKVKNGEAVEIEVEINDKAVEQIINKLWGYAKHNYVQSVYGIPESFRFP
jgi:hypothetical protein